MNYMKIVVYYMEYLNVCKLVLVWNFVRLQLKFLNYNEGIF